MSDMRAVSKEEFYALIGPLNVHPRCERDAAYWETPGRILVGITTPGYMREGETSYRTNLPPKGRD